MNLEVYKKKHLRYNKSSCRGSIYTKHDAFVWKPRRALRSFTELAPKSYTFPTKAPFTLLRPLNRSRLDRSVELQYKRSNSVPVG